MFILSGSYTTHNNPYNIDSTKRAIIYCSGQLTEDITRGILIAVDGGANILQQKGVIPNLLIGDMDSIDPVVLEHFKNSPETEVISYNVQKNETDTELAVCWCINQGIKEIVIKNDLGGFFAHTLGLVAHLYQGREKGIKITIESSREIVMLTTSPFSFSADLQTKISLIPMTDSVTRVFTKGLLYPLKGEDLYRKGTRGLSNVFIDEKMELSYTSGELIMVVEK